MFLQARIFALVLYSILVAYTYFPIKNSKSTKNTKRVLAFSLIALAIMAYFYLPYKTADLYGTNNYIEDKLQPLSFESMLSFAGESKNPVAIIYYWIFGKIGNLSLLPAFTALVFYSIVFYISYKSYVRKKWSNKTLAKVILFILVAGQFLEVISGIRCMLAYSVVALCMFRENILGKKIMYDIPLYIVAILMHDSCLVAVSISLISYALFSNIKPIYKIIITTMLSITTIVLSVILKQYFFSFLEHGQHYISGVDEYGRQTYFYIWEYINAIICVFAVWYSLRKTHRVNNEKAYYVIIILLLLFTIIFSFEYSIFERSRTLLMIISIPMIGDVADRASLEKNERWARKYMFVLYVVMFVVYIISVTRGNLCNLKFFA